MMTWHLGLTALGADGSGRGGDGAAGDGSVGVMQMMCGNRREGGMAL